jgi:hypothetical protein
MPTNELWTDAQRRAWDYVKAGENSGLAQTEALAMYRSGGGKIRTADWGELWHRYDEGVAQWDRLYQFKSSDTVPAGLFTEVGINYAERYTMTFTSSVRDEFGNIVHNVQRQVSSNRLLTLGEWQSEAAQLLYDDPSQGVAEVNEITDVQFYERME